MSNTTIKQPSRQSGLFSNLANPVIRKLEKNGEYDSASYATYSGIIGKTVFFLLATIIGVLVCFIIHNILMNSTAPADIIHFNDAENGIYDLAISPIESLIMIVVLLVSLITPFLAWIIRPTIPVTGTIYSVAQGMLIGYITVGLAQEYKFISLLAMIITLTLVGGMLFVYAKRIIKVNARFRGIITAIFFSIIASGIIYFILMIIPAVRNSAMFSSISGFLDRPAVSIFISIVYVIIAALFMLADFDTVERCVTNKVDKKYEWMAAWGLAYTILYIYFKILRILIMIFGNSRSNSSSKSRSF